MVYLELLRRGYQVKVGVLDHAEIDFVAQRHGERLYVQVAYLLASPDTVQREFGDLERIPDNYPKLVLSMDEVGPDQRNGIRQQQLVEFLLEEATGEAVRRRSGSRHAGGSVAEAGPPGA